MKFEKLNESNGKGRTIFLCGLITGVGLLIIFNLFLTKAKYKVVDSAKLVNSTINYSNADLNVIAMYKKEDGASDYEPIEEIPTGNYDIDIKESYCVVKDSKEKIYNVMEYKENKVYIGIDKKGTKCYVYFDKIKPASEKQLANLGLTVSKEGCPETDQNGNANITDISSSSDNLLCAAQDDYGETYYFRGNVDKNWVKIGETYWRIIRINGNGTIRLIYNGKTKDTVGTTTMAFSGSGRAYNTSYNDNAYVGFMYGTTGNKKTGSDTTAYDKTHANTTLSNILTQLNTWYNSAEFPAEYKDVLDGETGFCNDRSPYKYSGISSSDQPDKKNYGMGTESTYYGPYFRIYQSKYPTLKCPQKENDLFTTRNDSNNGNQKLTNPVGLITADEVEYAGAYQTTTNKNYYLYNDEPYWTMSPRYFDGSNALVFCVYANGYLDYTDVNNTNLGVRPVINLKASTKFTTGGNGTSGEAGSSTNPFVVKLN